MGPDGMARPGMLDARVAQALAVPTRAQLLGLLRDTGSPMTAADLADSVGLHVNTARSHLEQLVEAGLASRAVETPTGPGRPHVVYRAAPPDAVAAAGAQPDLDAPYRDLAAALINELAAGGGAERLAVDAGRRWAEGIDQMRWASGGHDAADAMVSLVDLLERLGFAPSTEPLGDRIYLHACPFAELARSNPDVVCGVHLGLLRGAVERLATPLEVTGVDPFVREGICLVHLRTRP